jgi:hypothetical protein
VGALQFIDQGVHLAHGDQHRLRPWWNRCGEAASAEAFGSRSRSRFSTRTTATAPGAASTRTFGETQGRVPREGFRLISGEELIRVYRPADDAGVKAFCSQCGSSLFGRTWPEGPEISVRLGALDGDPGIRPEFHTYVASKAPWDELPDDDLPRYPDEPPSR